MTSIWMPLDWISSPLPARKESQKILDGPLFRFVILHHTGWISGNRGDHWDWMLEPASPHPGGLIAFASTADPRTGWLESELDALPPHRWEYLDYQGPVSGGRGYVHRVAEGLVRWHPSPSNQHVFDLVCMEFQEAPSAPWPTGRYCLTRHDETPSTAWRLVRLQVFP